MLSVYIPSESSLKKVDLADTAALPESAVWIDMVKPTSEEDRAVERLAGIAVLGSRFPAGSISRTAHAT